jgi:hypothetical protein
VAFTSAGAVWVVGPAGDSARVLVPQGERAADPRAVYVSWSDDGRTLYYLAVDPAGKASIWSVAVTGGPPRLMVRFDDPSRECDIWAAEVEAAR